MKGDALSETQKSSSSHGPLAAPRSQAVNHFGSHLPFVQFSGGVPGSAGPLRNAAGPPLPTASDHDASISVTQAGSSLKNCKPVGQQVAPVDGVGTARSSFPVQTGEPRKPTGGTATGPTPAGVEPSHPVAQKAGEAKISVEGAAEHLYLQVAAQKQQRCTPIDRTDSRPPGEFIRRHGFTQPFQVYQVASWVLFGLDIVMFYLVVIPAVSVPLKAVFGVTFGLTAITLFITAYKCTRTDPVDPLAFVTGPWSAPVEGQTPEERQEQMESELAEATRTCNVCGGVQERSKHCRSCNKCVDVFDHHCIWINNCVGKANYREFVSMLTAAAVMVLMLIAMSVYQIIMEVLTGASGPHWRQAYQWFNPVAFYIISVVPVVTNLPILGLVVQLLMLHVYLMYHHMTTFDYITMRVEEELMPDCEAAAQVEKKSPRVRYRACTEWIVIDKKRLRRARRRASLTGHPSDVSQCAPAIGLSPSVELQAVKGASEKNVCTDHDAGDGKPLHRVAAEEDALISKV